jgi:hypothetical protein
VVEPAAGLGLEAAEFARAAAWPRIPTLGLPED